MMIAHKLISILLLSSLAFAGKLNFLKEEHATLRNRRSVEITHGDGTICQTDSCRLVADEFLTSINKSVNPCDDFYEFVCGKWTVNKIPGYDKSWDRFDLFQKTVNERIKGILETEPEPTDILPVRQAKKWYRSCIDEENLEDRGVLPLQSMMMRMGGWPMAMDPEEYDEDEHDWRRIEDYYFLIGGTYIFYKFDAPPYEEDEFEYIGVIRQISPGDLPLEGKIPWALRRYQNEDYEAYVDLVAAVTTLFADDAKSNITDDMIVKDARDLVEFEKKLFMINNFAFKYVYSVTTLGEYINEYDDFVTWTQGKNIKRKINFRELMQTVFETINADVDDSIKIGVKNKRYFIKLTALLNKTPKRTIINYIHWHFLSGLIDHIDDDIRELLFILMKELYGVSERKPRWMECVEEIELKDAVAFAFTSKYFPEETKKKANEMVESIRKATEGVINNSNFLDDDGRSTTISKLQNMTVFLGFPDWYKNHTAVVNLFKGLVIGSDYMDNTLSFRKYTFKNKFRFYLMQQGHIAKTDVLPTTVNAFYYRNSVVVPAADVQSPLFTPGLPESVNYGITGLLIAHEMGHGFDSNGIRLNQLGETEGLSDSALSTYYSRAGCFIMLFNKLVNQTTEDKDVTETLGYKTLAENLADAMGLQAVYNAYQELLRTNDDVDTRLPNLEEYTYDQMFFISYASTWCQVATPEFAAKQAERDVHSPNRLRVIAGVSNSKDFAKAFNCPVGSPMNPERKCDIWNDSESDESD